MKKIYWLFLMLLTIGFGACDAEVEEILFDDTNTYIAFESSSTSIAEDNGAEVRIPVLLSTATPKTVTVDFEIVTEGMENPAVEGEHYELLNESKTLTFNSGMYTNAIRIKVIDNELRDLDKQMKIKLSSNSEGLNMGLANGMKAEFSVIIADNEHPLSLILGDFVEEEFDMDGVLDPYSGNTVSILPDPNDETKVLIMNFWGINEGAPEENHVAIIATVDIENKTLSILPGQVLFVHDTYGECKAIRVDLSAGAYDPEGAIVCQIDENGNITSEAWAALVEAGYFGLYSKTVFTKK